MAEYMNPNNGLPDNVTDLDLQNQLVDSIQDEFEQDSSSESVGNLDLQMSSQRLNHIFNRQKRLDHENEAVIEHNNRLIKVPTANLLQCAIFELI
jgi:hypothetical protein